MSKQKAPRVHIGDFHNGVVYLVVQGTKAGLVTWEQTDAPPVPHRHFPQGGALSFQTTIGELTVRTGWASDPSFPAWNWPIGVLTIAKPDGETLTITDNSRVVAGGVEPQVEFPRFISELCEAIQKSIHDRSIIASLERELLQLFHPA